VLAITHLSNVTGLRLPVRELCEVAHHRGIFVHVDGAQTWGALQVNLHDLGCDTYSASSHKWLCGPKEAGVLYVRQDRIRGLWPHSVAPGWGEDVDPDVRGARKFESLGQRDDACLAAVGTAVDFHDAIGPARVETRVRELATGLKDRVVELGARLVTPREFALSGGVCVIAVAPLRRREVYERLYRQFGIAGAPTGGLRLCPHVYNTSEHVERALEGVKALRGLVA
jgi:selenocysteine lyase/cysteine desulfurase